MSSLKTLPEKFLYARLPPGVVDGDLRGVLESIVGGLQDRLEDLRAFADKYETLLDPNSPLPEVAFNVLLVEYVGRGASGTLKRSVSVGFLDQLEVIPRNEIKENIEYAVVGGKSISYGGMTILTGGTFKGVNSTTSFTPLTTEVVYRKEDLYELLSSVLELDAAAILKVTLETDNLRLVEANILQNLAATVGSNLYDQPVETQRKILSGHFARLKLKGTLSSYEILGKLIGFDNAKLTPLWGRMSPRVPDEIGNQANNADFNSLPQFEPVETVSVNYDPRDVSDGPFYTWESEEITDTNDVFSAVNGHNPFISVRGGIQDEIDLEDGVYILEGGGPQKKASVEPEGSGLVFEALAEGESFNGLKIVVDDNVITVTWKLSSIKFRTSFFNLALTVDWDDFLKQYRPIYVLKNDSLEADPTLVQEIPSTPPHRPYSSFSSGAYQPAPATAKQVDTAKLIALGIQSSHYFEELRTATRLPRQISVGFNFNDTAGYAPFSERTELVGTSGSLPSHPTAPFAATIALETPHTEVLTRTNRLHTFKARLAHPPVPGTIVIPGVGSTPDDGNGGFPTSTLIDAATIDYTTGDIELVYKTTAEALTASVSYRFYDRLTAETDTTTSDNLINFKGTKGEGWINFTDHTWQFTPNSFVAGTKIFALWTVTSTEVIRSEPSLPKTFQERPEDEAFTLIGSIDGTLEEKSWMHGLLQMADDASWIRPVAGGEILDKDIYLAEGKKVDDISEVLTVIDHRGIEHDVIGFDAYSDAPQKPIRVEYVERDHSSGYKPGRTAIALKGSDLYHVGLVQGVMMADPDRFLNDAHTKDLVGWLPFNLHPNAKIDVKDHSAMNSVQELEGLLPTDREWDEKRGWTQTLRADTSVESSKFRNITSAFTLSFWFKPKTMVDGLTPVLTFGGLEISMGLIGAVDVTVFSWNTGTVDEPYMSMMQLDSIPDGDFVFVAVRFTGTSVKITFNSLTFTHSTFEWEYSTEDVLKFMGGDNAWRIHDFRIWNSVKSDSEIAQIKSYGFQKTIVPYTRPYFKTAGRKTRWGLKVLDSGFVVPEELSTTRRESLARVTRYNDQGRYTGEAKFKETGLAGESSAPARWQLGRRFSAVLGSGHLPIVSEGGSKQINCLPSARRLVYSTTVVTPPSVPTAPTGVTATGALNKITVAWSAVAGATSYRVFRSTTNGGPYTELASLTGTTHDDTTVVSGTTYYYVVKAFNYSGGSPNSAQVSAAPLYYPAAPSNLRITLLSGTTTTLKLDWIDNSNNETGFKIERSLDGSTWGAPVTVGAGVVTYNDAGLSVNTVYYYRIYSYNGLGNSTYATGNGRTGGPVQVLDLINVDYSFTAPALGHGALSNNTYNDYWNNGPLGGVLLKSTAQYNGGNNSGSLSNITLSHVWSSYVSEWFLVPAPGTTHPSSMMYAGLSALAALGSGTITPFTINMAGVDAGTYDLLVYGHGPAISQSCKYAVQIGANPLSASKETSSTDVNRIYMTANWTEGYQYVRFNGLVVSTGEDLKIEVQLNSQGFGGIQGFQLLRTA